VRSLCQGAALFYLWLDLSVKDVLELQDWAGGEQVTLAIVFTDVVGSTALGEDIRDETMNEVRRAHFAQSRRLTGQFQGREIKTIGDSLMAAFRSADGSREVRVG
jgi:class 3 adenylate cyclase